MQNRKKKTDLQNSLLDSVGEGEGGMFQENSIETCAVSRVKQITSPGWMHETSAPTWCTGKTQGERVEREVGGVIGMGNTCKPMAVSFQCMTKFTTKKKKKKHCYSKKKKKCKFQYYKQSSCLLELSCFPCSGVLPQVLYLYLPSHGLLWQSVQSYCLLLRMMF